MNAGLVAFLVILALIVAAVLLFRSMTHQMRKVPPSFDEPDQPPEAGSDGQSSGRA
jgi:hypothetical protein